MITILALSEALQGQLIVALIGAIPPTGAVIVAIFALMRGQEKMHKALDGKLTELVQAKTEVARAEGMQQERVEERERVAEAAPVVAAVIAQAAAAAVNADPDKVSKMEIVNQDENPVPTRAAKPVRRIED